MMDFTEYQANSTIHATPMTGEEYKDYFAENHVALNGKIANPSAENDSEHINGFLVVYNKDSGERYDWWSPKKQHLIGFV